MVLTHASNPRSVDAVEHYERAGQSATWRVAANFTAVLSAAGEGMLLVTGSFYLAAEAYLQLGIRL